MARTDRDAGFDRVALYRTLVRINRVEEALAELWRRGYVSGELHLGLGEEAVAAGVCAHLREGDALAIDHRSTPPLIARGVDVTAILFEAVGSEQGLCHGRGGHMHLFSPEHLAASSGIVGASGPLGAGFALAAQHLRPGSVAVAFFGEGALNQGMLLESFNLASIWNLPLVFVCKDNGWAITTRSRTVTSGDPRQRARGFGMAAARLNGADVDAVWRAARGAICRARSGGGPTLLHARVARPAGHFCGDPLLRVLDHPLSEARGLVPELTRGLLGRPGATAMARLRGMAGIEAPLAVAAFERMRGRGDPISSARSRIPGAVASRIEASVQREVDSAFATVIAEVDQRRVP
ncbi:MAG TPA: thiamine pyrophosphate-dependent dehydrogenase E1 component subunit alpha [Candidatus Binatia bacterium]|nr:thiamine pyrophosphate-dependent dehydrogenase E1 component subunit alpha [Candidatus Binatia bacterium]